MIIKRILYLYIILVPYLIAMSAILILCKEVSGTTLFLFGVSFVLICSAGWGAILAIDIISIIKSSTLELSIWYLIVKVLHLPVHILLFLLFGGMLNPFLLIVSWVPIIASMGLIGMSGAANVGNCISNYKKGIHKRSTAIIFGVLSFVYIIDLLIAIIQVAKCVKYSRSLIIT